MQTQDLTLLSAASTAANVTSIPLRTNQNLAYCITVVLTGAPTGSAQLQGSADGTTFINVPGTANTLTVAAATGSAQFVSAGSPTPYKALQVVWTGSGTGTITAQAHKKDA